MTLYKANSIDLTTFTLTKEDQLLGELKYSKWYSFRAEIILPGQQKYELVPKGFWDSKIELVYNEGVLINFKMGWKGILINTKFNGFEQNYLLKLKGLFAQQICFNRCR